MRHIILFHVVLFSMIVGCSGSDFAGSDRNKGAEKNKADDKKEAEKGDQNLGADGDDDDDDLGNGGNNTEGGGDLGDGGNTGDGDCEIDLSKDFIKFKFGKEVEECHDAGNVWNFWDKDCSTISQASFDCDWNGVEDANFVGPTIYPGVDKKDVKLVGCGEADGGDTKVWQYVKVPETEADKIDCNFSASTYVYTHCISKDADTAQEIQGAGSDEDKINVCLNKSR